MNHTMWSAPFTASGKLFLQDPADHYLSVEDFVTEIIGASWMKNKKVILVTKDF